MTLQLKQYAHSIQDTVLSIKNAIKRRDAKAAINYFSRLPEIDYDDLWKLLRLWSATLVRFPDTNTLIAVRVLYDNYLLDPQKDFIERALIVLAYGNIAS